MNLDFWVGLAISVPLSIAANLMTNPIQLVLRSRKQKALANREEATRRRLARRDEATVDAEYRHHLEQRTLEYLITFDGSYTRAEVLLWVSAALVFMAVAEGWSPAATGGTIGALITAVVVYAITGRVLATVRRQLDDLSTARLDALDVRDAASYLEDKP